MEDAETLKDLGFYDLGLVGSPDRVAEADRDRKPEGQGQNPGERVGGLVHGADQDLHVPHHDHEDYVLEIDLFPEVLVQWIFPVLGFQPYHVKRHSFEAAQAQ